MYNSVKKRSALSLFAALMLALSLSGVLDVACRDTIDRTSETYLNDTLKKALYTYGIARITNGVVSVAQSSTVGVGVTVGIGEFLDPINDLIERFSWVMLISAASLGIQKVLMEIGAWMGLRILLSISMLLLLAGIWRPRLLGADLVGIGLRVLLVALFVRLLIPVVGLAGSAVDELFLESKYEESIQAAEEINQSVTLEGIVDEQTRLGREEPAAGFFEGLRRMADTSSLKERYDALKEKLSTLVPRLVDLIVVFAVQTIVLPLIVLWAMLVLFRNLGAKISLPPYRRESPAV